MELKHSLAIWLYIFCILNNVKDVEMFTQWECKYTSDGEVSYCRNITELDRSILRGQITVNEFHDRTYYNVSVSDISAWYLDCSYHHFNISWPDTCDEIAVVFTDRKYNWCYYFNGIYQKPYVCFDESASNICIKSQPHTNRLLHRTIPLTIYITGIVFNILTLCVLHLRAERSVMNWLLKMLSVWDLLYLGCLVIESVIGHYTGTSQVQISDTGYAWMFVRCKLSGDSMHDESCKVKDNWKYADANINIASVNYTAMYWFHLAALVFQIASVYQTTVIATFRCIAIRWPFQAHQLLSETKAAVATAGCLLLGVLLHIPSFIAAEKLPLISCWVKYISNVFDDNKRDECVQCRTNLTVNMNNPLYKLSATSFMNFYSIYDIIIYSIIMFMALPFVILLTLNILMLSELYRGSGASHSEENITVTKVVIAIVSIFLLTYTVKPLYIIDIYYFSGNVMDLIADTSCAAYFSASLLVSVLPAVNSVVNFLLYICLRKTFRQQFVNMFGLCRQNTNF